MPYFGNEPAKSAIKVGDNTILSSSIADGVIINADIKSDAAIAMSKTALAAGTGITLATNTLNVDAAQTQITSVGTIGTGVWQGTPITAAYLNAAQTNITSVGTLTGLTVASSSADAILTIDCSHASSDALLIVEAASGRDSVIRFTEADTTKWQIFNDGSDSDKLKFEDDGDVRLTLDQSGNATFAGYAQITNGLRTATGTERYLIFREGNELNTYTSSGVGDSNRATLHINHLGAGSTVDLSDSELVVVKGTGSTFNGTVLIDGLSNYTGLEVKGSGGSRPQVKWTNANNGVIGSIYGTEGNALVLTSGTGGATALTLDSSQNATFGGTVTTVGAIEVTSCPDNNALTFDQSGREHSIYTYFSGTTASNRMTFRVGTGSTGGTKVDVIDLYGDKRAIFQGNITTEGQIISKNGMEIQGTSLAGSQSGIASSGTGGSLRMYISGNQNYTFSGHTLTIDSQGNGSPAQLTCKNTGSSGWTGAAINLLYEGSGGNRGCGVYMHSAATDKEWYAGTMYSVDTDRYSICYESTASFTEATAAAAHEVFYIGTAGQTWANGGYYATYNGSAVHALVGHTNELNICNSWTSGQNQIHFNYRMGNTYGDFTFFNGSSSGYPDLNAGSFDTTSDYRMKKSVTNFTANVCDKIKLLRPVTYKWKANTKMTEAQQIGFLAHELQEQLPLAVKGEKDAMSEKDNTKIEPQTIKGEALSSYMMKALQEIITRLEVLENA